MGTRLLLLLMAVCLLRGVVDAQVKEVVMEDFFSDNSNAWPEDIVRDSYSSRISDGTYYLDYLRQRGSHVFDIPVNMVMSQNYYYELTGMITSNNKQEGCGFGIAWGKGNGGYLSFAITEDGRFYVRKVGGGKSEFLLGPTKIKVVYANRMNKLRVQCAGNEFTFFVNDHYVGHLPRELYYGNNAGVILYGRQCTEIYSFGAYGTKNYTLLPGYNADMKVSYFEIEDGFDASGVRLGNGDCKVQPSEEIVLKVVLRNMGEGPCKNLNARFFALSDYVTIVGQESSHRIVSVPPHQTHTMELRFRVSMDCTLESINFKLDITDDKGLMAESVPLSVPMYTKISPINKDQAGKVSFTLNFKRTDITDVNTFFPITLQNSRTTAAVVVGVESYAELPKAVYATNDAKIMRQYFLKVLNMPLRNVIAVSNQNATKQRLESILRSGGELELKNARNVVFYFSGLGLCEPGKTDPYVMLYNSKLSDPKGTGYSVKEIVRQLRSLVQGDVICIFETSFAGVDRSGAHIGNSGSVWGTAIFPTVLDDRTCVMYASGNSLPNPVMEKSSHGLFTHYVLSAMQEFGINRNLLDMKTLFDYVNQGMDEEASRRGIKVYPRMDCINKDGIFLLR